MKKYSFFLLALLSFLSFANNVKADVEYTTINDAISVGDDNLVELREGAEGVITINVTPGERIFRNTELALQLPKGLDVVWMEDPDLPGTMIIKAFVGDEQKGVDSYYSVKANQPDANNPQYVTLVVSCMGNLLLKDGVLLQLYVQPDETLNSGDVLTGKVTGTGGKDNIIIAKEDGSTGWSQSGFEFSIKIVDNLIVFEDTKSYEDFESVVNANVQVKRAVKANTWNTICLPFAMTATQIKNVFGEGAKVADFTGCDTEKDINNKIIGIKVNFELVTSMDYHHPYLLKVVDEAYTKTAVNGFTVEGVDVMKIPEGGPQVNKDPESVSIPGYGTITTFNKFVGIYVPNKTLGSKEEPAVFLSNNMFWYAQGNSTLNGFRGYFIIRDIKAYIDGLSSSSNLSFFVDGEEATSIDGVTTTTLPVEGVYDLQGRKVEIGDNGIDGLQKGIYIINGKKVTVK